MMQKTEMMNNQKNWKLTFLTLFIIYATDTLIISTNADRRITTIASYATILVTVALVYQCIKSGYTLLRVNPFEGLAITGVVMYLIIALLRIDGEYTLRNYVFYAILLIFGLLFAKLYSVEEFCYKYVSIMRFIAIFSLVMYFVGLVWFGSLTFLPQIQNTSGKVFYTAFFSNVPTYSQSRNWGPFWEPGAYQCYLNLALIFSLFVVEDHKKINSLLFSIASFTTLSGATLIPVVLILFAFFIDRRSSERINKIYLILFSIIIVIVFFTSGYIDSILNKMATGGSNSSLQIRLSSIIASILSFLQNPLLGISIEKQRIIMAEVSMRICGFPYLALVNTYPGFFANYGIVIGLFYFLGTWKFIRQFSDRLVAVLLFFAIIFMTSNENLTASLLISVLPFLRSKNLIKKGGFN